MRPKEKDVMSEKRQNDRQRQRLSVQAAMRLGPDGCRRLFAVTVPGFERNTLAERVLVCRGQIGHFAVPKGVDWVALRNAQTTEETNAALAGSMIGWHVPAAEAAMRTAGGAP
jgi:hypothetical protein